MREIEVQVREREAALVAQLADEHGGFAPSLWPITRGGADGWCALGVNLPNERVGGFLSAVAERVEEAEFVLQPHGTLPVRTPVGDVRDRVVDVSRRSTYELVLDSLQSIGSWKGLLVYATVSGLVAAYGVMFNVPWLLTAAMLIAPMGAPAMVCVVGVAVGDHRMVGRGALRFVVALGITAAAAALLGLAYGIQVATATMELITALSSWTALLAVAGGAAGAQALVQAERDSMVTATATGFLVAVALSPPSAVLGLALTLGRWEYVALMAFVLLLTFFGILAGGWLSLRMFGVDVDDPAPSEGSRRVRAGLAAAAVLATLLLVGWQSTLEPRFQKADLASRAVVLTREAVSLMDGVRLIEASAHFTRQDAEWHTGEGLIVDALVKRTTPGASDDAVRDAIERAVEAQMTDVEAFVDLTVLP